MQQHGHGTQISQNHILNNGGPFVVLCNFQVVVPVLSNSRNHNQWPHVVSQDIMRHIHSLKNNVFVVAGQVKGKTLLPLPLGSERVEQAVLERDKRYT